jgi:hypothetical protein
VQKVEREDEMAVSIAFPDQNNTVEKSTNIAVAATGDWLWHGVL